jgi:hypothetical protein
LWGAIPAALPPVHHRAWRRTIAASASPFGARALNYAVPPGKPATDMTQPPSFGAAVSRRIKGAGADDAFATQQGGRTAP